MTAFRVDPKYRGHGAVVQQWRWWWPFWSHYTETYSPGMAETLVNQLNGRQRV